MAEEKNNTAEDEISLKELILKLKEWYLYLLSKWKTILIAGILGGALGLAYAFMKKPVYTATTTFVLEEGDSKGGLGAYAGLASMVGIDLGGGGGGVFEGDNILELYKSRRMVQKTLLSQDTFEGKKELLIHRYIAFNKLREKWEDELELKDISFNIDINRFTLKHDSLINLFYTSIIEDHLAVSKPDKKLSIIKVEFKSKDELFAKSFTENIVFNVNDFYVKTKTKKSAENLNILQQQADSVKRVLNASIGGVAAAIDANPNSNPAFQSLRVGSQRKQVDVQASAAVYQEIVKNLELAKVTFRKDKPLIQVIDEPVLPLLNNRIKEIKGIFLGGIIFIFMAIILLLINKLYKNILA
jgi:hypothetical protein